MKTKLYTTILLLLALCLPTGAFGQAQIANYVRTKTMTAANGSTYLDEITYIGGNGKPYQSVQKGITPSGKSLIVLHQFNNSGQEAKRWLPIEQNSDYTSSYPYAMGAIPNNFGGDTRPFHETAYESSAVGRVTAEYGPGQAWANNPIRYDYGTNTANGVLSLIRYTVGSNYALTANGTVPAGTLNVTKVTDEDGHEAYSFTDHLGRTLLERRLNGSEQLDTYYVYDSYGHLCYVLQPMYQSEADLSKYAYRYEYDSRGRCTKKTLPGTEYVLYEYNDDDLLVFSQDGRQRVSNQWTYYLYDSAKRLSQQGVCTGKNTSSNAVQHIRHYYDTYSFIGSTGFTNSNYTTDSSIYGRGRKTGSIISVLGTSEKVYVAYYYNSKGELIKQVESNNMSGHDVHAYTYTFTGQPASMTHTHTASGKPTITEVLTYTYDHGERLTKVTHKLNNAAAVTIAEYTYDKYGRVASKTMHGNTTSNKVDYTYNIRGWVTDVVYPYFRQTLTYNNGTTGFNGNITKMTWRTANNSEQNYSFTYDGANRMLDAIYSETGSLNQNVDRYTEKVTEYDKNGNIKKLQRYGQTGASSYGLVDNLTYNYNGNKVTRVDDATTATSYTGGTNFVNGASTSNEYVYDQNGNLTKDLNKNITDIQYNSLNLPSVLTFSDGSTITYTYTHDGKKLRTVHVIGGVTTTTDYCGNVIYENGTAKRLLTDEGYVDLTTNTYYYYMKDHQGNNRAVVNSSGTVQETNHYYPFGGLFAANGSVQPYKYNGKEIDTKKGLNLYDYGARHYDAALGRFTTIDPKSEDLTKWSMYSYCYDNPIKFVDPDGKRGRPTQRPIRRGLRNGGRPTSIYGFFNLPKPQSTQMVTTYKYRGGLLREKMALGEQNYLPSIQTFGGKSIQSNVNTKSFYYSTGMAELIEALDAIPDSPSFHFVSTKRYSDDGEVMVETDIIFNDPILSVMQANYDAAYRRLNESLGEIDIKGKNLMEILQLFDERRDLIINQIGLSPKELLMNELMYNGGNFQVQSTHSLILQEFRQGY